MLKPGMALMSRKGRARARRFGLRYSFFFMRAEACKQESASLACGPGHQLSNTSSTSLATRSPIARHAVSPGDSIPTA